MTKIAVGADGADGVDLDAPLATNFARSPFFLVVRLEDMTYETVANPWATAPGGAGPEAARMVSELGAEAAITALVGPNAFTALRQAGIQVFVATGGSVRSAVQAYRAAHLPPLLAPNARAHAPFSGPGSQHVSTNTSRSWPRRRRQGARQASGTDTTEQLANMGASLRAMAEELAALRQRLKDLEGKSAKGQAE